MLNEIYDRFIKKAAEAGYQREELVLGCGRENGGVVLIGEAPGKDEVIAQRPFVGKAGKILDEFLEKTGIRREDLFITNTVKLRPYKVSAKGTKSNRPPNAAELKLCRDCLFEELSALAPKLIVTLGNTPLKAVLEDKAANIGAVHGTVIRKDGLTIYPIYHPASLIYNRSLSDVYEEDLRQLKELLASL